MIVADIVGALGNQLFSYAATKSIALDLGYEYRYRVVRPGCASPPRPSSMPEGSYIDNEGQEYCEYFEKVFHIDTTERIAELPASISSEWTWKRLPSTNYNKDVYSISNNTHLCGYFLHPKYFEHRRTEILKWFHFQDVYIERCRKQLHEITESKGATHLVSIHVRYGKFLRSYGGLAIDPSYYGKAIQRIRKELSGEKLCFILFSDVPNVARRLLKKEKDIVLHSGTMFEDLCSMALCDSHIIANSTFSWWGAWLADETKGLVLRPSIWPIAYKNQPLGPLDIYPSDWIGVDASIEKLTIGMIVGSAYKEYPPTYCECPSIVVSWFRKIKNGFKRNATRLFPQAIVNALKSQKNDIITKFEEKNSSHNK